MALGVFKLLGAGVKATFTGAKALGKGVFTGGKGLLKAVPVVGSAAVPIGVGLEAVEAKQNGVGLWQQLKKDVLGIEANESVGEFAAKEVVGEEAVEGAKDVAKGVGSAAKSVTEFFGGGSDGGTGEGQGQGQSGSWLSNLLSPLKGIGNMFSGLFNGNSSGLGIGTLVAAGFLMFGNFGWLGKIGSVLLAMLGMNMLTGNSSQQTQQVAAAPARGESAGVLPGVGVAPDVTQDEGNEHYVRRSR